MRAQPLFLPPDPVDPLDSPDLPDPPGPQEPPGPPAIEIAGERLELLAHRAVAWPAQRTLFVADVHLGKVESFRAQGVPVPRGATQSTLERLSALLLATDAKRLVVLGDLLHARWALEPATLDPLRNWRDAHRHLACLLIRGNHDDHAGDPPADLDIQTVDAPWRLGPFALCHEPMQVEDAYALAGHTHPAVRLNGRGGDSLRLPCFRFGPTGAVLPAFGDFTGGMLFEPNPGERLFAIAQERVFELPLAPPRRSGRWR